MLKPPFDFDIIQINDLYIFTTTGIVTRLFFDKWLTDNDRLDWIHDTVDHHGDHQQTEGTMTIDEYFETSDHQTIAADIIDYSNALIKKIRGTNFTSVNIKSLI